LIWLEGRRLPGSEVSVATRIPLENTLFYESHLPHVFVEQDSIAQFRSALRSKSSPQKGPMNDSQTNLSAVTEAAPPSSPAVENSEKAPRNALLAEEVSTPTPSDQGLLASQPRNAAELCAWIEWSIQAQTHLPQGISSLIAFWVMSTWFQDALTVLPCLVISGLAHDAMVVLRILDVFCRKPVLVAEFRKGDLDTLNWGCETLLISEPNLDNRKAALLGNLTNRGFRIVADGRALDCAKSRAIYIGEDPSIKRIQHSIIVNITPTNTEPPTSTHRLQTAIDHLPSYLETYREKNLDYVRRLAFSPSGVPSETAAIAKALGSCIVASPELQQKLVALLKAQDQRHLSQKLDTTEAVVVEAALALSRQERQHVYVREVAVEANRLLEGRGERLKLNPEKVGHKLRKLGLPTRRLTKTGNGLVLDKATVAEIQRVAAVYVGEDLLVEAENLHCAQVTENK